MKLSDYGHKTYIWEPVPTNPKQEQLVAIVKRYIPTEELRILYPNASAVTYEDHGLKLALKL